MFPVLSEKSVGIILYGTIQQGFTETSFIWKYEEKKSKKTERENDAELTTEIEIGKRKREKKQKKMEKNIFKN